MDKSLKVLDIVIALAILIVAYGVAYFYELTQGGGIWFKIFPLIYLPGVLFKEFIMRKIYKEKYKELYLTHTKF
ncbi:hypothetical protein [Clostridium hydrogeniformans]|uniref:hypothetical protein n=1 Tax=Clostridium hydrogeniformans TaxID=349933 RepID=UPI0004880769|nr:hypothetical protein [Clostridium hydrogeniformans]